MPVRRLLRQHVLSLHAHLNRHPLVAGITRSDYSLDAYRAVLVGYQRFYRQLEPAIVRCLSKWSLPFHYDELCRTRWLDEDLRYFGLAPADGAAPGGVPEPDSPGQVIGVLYAIEGSSLGGQVIVRSLAAHHGLAASAGARFFDGYGAQTERRWGEYCAFAESISGNPQEIGKAEGSAAQIFRSIGRVLDECDAGLQA